MSERKLFIGFCWGAAGTTWLARLLNSHPDIFSMHAPILPRYDHSRLPEAEEILDHVFTDHSFGGTYPIVGVTHGIAPEWHETFAKKYGTQLRCFSVTRHPVHRIQSTFDLHVSLEPQLVADPTWSEALAGVYEGLTRLSDRSFPDDFESLAFYNACAMVNSVVWEREQAFPLFRLEDLVSRAEVVQALIAHVSDRTRELREADIRTMQQTVVHSHSWRRRPAADVYAGWRPEHRDAYRALVTVPALEAYRKLGYDLPEADSDAPASGRTPRHGRPSGPPAAVDASTADEAWAGVMDPGRPGVLSPLVGRSLGVAIPGLVGLERLSPWNGASVDAGPPLTVTLPRQRWAYGLLVALDHASLGADRTGPVVVDIDVVVEAGQVGIMGVAKGFERQTTAETRLDPGGANVRVIVNTPADTAAIAVRNVGTSDVAPRVALRAIQAHRPGSVCLAPRVHDLGFDLFVALAPYGTPISTIEPTLLALAVGAQVRLARWLWEPSRGADRAPRGHVPTELHDAHAGFRRALETEIAAVRALGGRIAFVTVLCEPVDSAVFRVFQALRAAVACFDELHAVGPNFVDALAAGLETQLRRESVRRSGRRTPDVGFLGAPDVPAWFLGEEASRLVGADLLTLPAEHRGGFTVLRHERDAILVVRAEHFERELAAGLSTLLDGRDVPLVRDEAGDDTPYRRLHQALRERLRLPADVVAALYEGDPYVRRFYATAEVEGFRRRWSEAFWPSVWRRISAALWAGRS